MTTKTKTIKLKNTLSMKHTSSCSFSILPGVLAALFSLCLISCDAKRSNTGPWEYAELGAVNFNQTTESINPPDKKESNNASCYFDTGDTHCTGDDFADLMKKMGAKDVKRNSSVAMLNFLDNKGWELISYNKALTRNYTPIITGSSFQGSGGSGVSGEITALLHGDVWILRRAK